MAIKDVIKNGLIISSICIAILLFLLIIFDNQTLAQSSSNSKILNSNAEVMGNNYLLYSGDVFYNYKGEWYDFISFANISLDDKNSYNITTITSTKDKISLEPYININNQIYKYRNIPTLTANQLNIKPKFIKARNTFEFSYNVTTTASVSDVGFYYKGFNYTKDKLYNDYIEIDFNDLIKRNYTIAINDSFIKITNLKVGLNDLDPIIQFYSNNTKDGFVSGVIGGQGSGTIISNTSTFANAGIDMSTKLEYRTFLAFNTSSLNFINTATANITNANLYFYSYIQDISDGTGLPCHIGAWNYTIRNGTIIGKSLTKEVYSKGQNHTTILTPTDNIYYKVNITNPISVINIVNETDFVIKSTFNATSDNLCQEYIVIDTGEGTNKPYLNITWANVTTSDTIKPLWNNSFANQSIVYANQNINFSIILTDEMGLNSAILSINLSNEFFNSSIYSISGTFINISNITKIQAIDGTNVTWYWYFNDTSNNVNITNLQSFIIADNTTPLYTNLTINSTFITNDMLINFSINLLDNLNLNNYLFSINLGNGFINSSIYSISGISVNVSNITRIITPNGQDTNVTWFFYFNDTYGNSNMTGLNSFIVDRLAPNLTILSPINTTYDTNPIMINISNSSNIQTLIIFYGTSNITNPLFPLYINYPDGSHYVEVYANDSSNNVNKTIVYFTFTSSTGVGVGGITIASPPQSFGFIPNIIKEITLQKQPLFAFIYVLFIMLFLMFVLLILIIRKKKHKKDGQL